MTLLPASSLSQVVEASFRAEVDALKPGNVSRYADGHGMRYADFVRSARVCTPILCDGQLGVGERLLKSVQATRAEVGCNTNLGMLLLFAPVIKAYQSGISRHNLKSDIKHTLEHLDQRDAQLVFEGIRTAKPGGLGQVASNDVNFIPDISLLEAMQQAADRDLVARQYVTGFEDIYNVGLVCLGEFDKRWNSVEWATVACYLALMTTYPDTHIRRKYGRHTAMEIQKRALPVFEYLKNKNNPARAKTRLLEFDRELKESGINPGTCADMTAASLLLYGLQKLVQRDVTG